MLETGAGLSEDGADVLHDPHRLLLQPSEFDLGERIARRRAVRPIRDLPGHENEARGAGRMDRRGRVGASNFVGNDGRLRYVRIFLGRRLGPNRNPDVALVPGLDATVRSVRALRPVWGPVAMR